MEKRADRRWGAIARWWCPPNVLIAAWDGDSTGVRDAVVQGFGLNRGPARPPGEVVVVNLRRSSARRERQLPDRLRRTRLGADLRAGAGGVLLMRMMVVLEKLGTVSTRA